MSIRSLTLFFVPDNPSEICSIIKGHNIKQPLTVTHQNTDIPSCTESPVPKQRLSLALPKCHLLLPPS